MYILVPLWYQVFLQALTGSGKVTQVIRIIIYVGSPQKYFY